jgi:hypothetical protein
MQINSYSHARQIMQTCRNHARGKPIKQGTRMFLIEGVIELHRYGEMFARLGSDNVVTFHGDPRRYWHVAASKIFPVHFLRVSSRRWRLASMTTYPQAPGVYTREAWDRLGNARRKWREEAPEYFDGLRYSLTTHDFPNRLPDTVRVMNQDNEQAWRKQMLRYKRGWVVRAKVGALDGICSDLQSLDHMRRSELYRDMSARDLHKIVVGEDFSNHALALILAGGAQDLWRWHFDTPSDSDVMKAFDRMYRKHRDAIRTELGCFNTTRQAA